MYIFIHRFHLHIRNFLHAYRILKSDWPGNIFSPQPTFWLKAFAIVVSVRTSVLKQLLCEHTQGYNSSPIAIIFDIQLVLMLIKVGIVNEPYPTRENGPTGLFENPL